MEGEEDNPRFLLHLLSASSVLFCPLNKIKKEMREEGEKERRDGRKVIQEGLERDEKGTMVPNHSSAFSANVMITTICDTR